MLSTGIIPAIEFIEYKTNKNRVIKDKMNMLDKDLAYLNIIRKFALQYM